MSIEKFRFTNAAYKYIIKQVDDFINEHKKDNFTVMLSWISFDASKKEIIPHPIISYSDFSDHSSYLDQSYDLGKFKVIIALDSDRKSECEKKILDYRCGQLTLVYEDDILPF